MITKSTPLKVVLEKGNECKRCGRCCNLGTGIAAEEDIENIAKHLELGQDELKERYLEPVTKFNKTLFRPKTDKKPYGTCVFFDDKKGCRINDVKPLQCRISNCDKQTEDITVWFTLNHFVNEHDPESIRQWALYLETGGKNIPGGKLEELVPDKKLLKKILSYEILR